MLLHHICKIAVNLMPQLNRVSMIPFWEELGGITEIERLDRKKWDELCLEHGVHPKNAERESAIQRAMGEASLMEKYGISLLCYDDYNYPQQLLECPDAPLVLYYKGIIEPNRDTLAIVGTRSASHECKEIINDIVRKIGECENQPIIISGLAHGIDICAQRAALENGLTTYAVVAHGLGMIYPAANRDIANRIINEQRGAIFSEYPCNYQPQKYLFLERNRIIAGMANWLLVGESSLKGGSMVTAKIAFSYGREIMAIPGSPLNPNAQGCNQLIKHNMAALIENGIDLIENIGLKMRVTNKKNNRCDNIALTIDEKVILDSLRRQTTPLNINEIARITRIAQNALPIMLLNLEMNSLIYALPGENYKIRK